MKKDKKSLMIIIAAGVVLSVFICLGSCLAVRNIGHFLSGSFREIFIQLESAEVIPPAAAVTALSVGAVFSFSKKKTVPVLLGVFLVIFTLIFCAVFSKVNGVYFFDVALSLIKMLRAGALEGL